MQLDASETSLYVTGGLNATTTFGSTTLSSPGSTSVGYLASLGTDALGAAPAATLAGVVLYPNPAHVAATVREPAGVGAATLMLHNGLDRAVRTVTGPAGTDCPLELASLALGVSAVRVQVGESAAVQKLVVE